MQKISSTTWRTRSEPSASLISSNEKKNCYITRNYYYTPGQHLNANLKCHLCGKKDIYTRSAKGKASAVVHKVGIPRHLIR